MMEENALVSVIMPVYNGDKYLASAIESVLAQTYRPLELIIVDDGSTDKSATIARSYQGARYIYQTNQGVAAARNAGLAAARGTFIAFLDADDTWPERKLQIQIDYLWEHPSVMFTIAKISNVPEPGLDMRPEALQSILRSDQIGMATMVARKKAFDQIGGFDFRYQVGEDLEWLTRAKDEGMAMVILSDILLHRRIHPDNLSIKQPQACNKARLRIFKESIDRQRKRKQNKMEKNNLLVSVIIPVYNGERFLSAAMESVLAQTYCPLELIVIDDGSTDNSAAIAKSYQPVRYFYQPNAGLSAALNKGLKVAQGSYFSFLDADDLWVKNKLALQMSMFGERPDLDIIFGHHQRFCTRDSTPNAVKESEMEKEILPALLKGAMLIKRDSFFRVGLFDTSLRVGDFIDWYKRATEIGLCVLMLPDVVMKRRLHDDHLSIRNQHAAKDYVRILKASLDRQRKNNSGINGAAK